jgi:hypothetical protein
MQHASIELHGDKAPKLARLRELLAEKFPASRSSAGEAVPSGLPQLDAQLGGLHRGSVTELAGSLGNGGLLLHALLHAAQRDRCFFALVDGGPCFAPEDHPDSLLARMLWVRCGDAQSAVKAADLLIRDGNLPLVALDLRMLAVKEVRRIPASTWHRFQRLAEASETALLVFSLQPTVEGAQVRVAAPRRWSLKAMEQRRHALTQEMELRVFKRGAASPIAAPGLHALSA